MTWPGRLAMQARLARDAPAFLRTTMGSAQAVEILRRQLTDREGRFLTVVRETVYAHPRSPYRALLEEARCTFEDLRELVTREGLLAAVDAEVVVVESDRVVALPPAFDAYRSRSYGGTVVTLGWRTGRTGVADL